MKNLLIKLSSATLLVCSMSAAQEIATWAGFRQGATVFTFDDGAPSHISLVAPEFDKFGYKASFYVVTNWIGNQYHKVLDWSGWQTLADNGHEIGSHSDSHPNGAVMPDEEIASSKNTINSNVKGQECNTITYPNCIEPDEATLKQNYIGGRICDGKIISKSPSNYYRLSSIGTGSADNRVTTTQNFTDLMNQAANQGGWVVFLTHGLAESDAVNGFASYSPTSLSAISGALAWAKQNDAKVWVTTFRNAIMYAQERDASTLTLKSSDAQSVTYTLTHSLSTNIVPFDYPLSIRVQNTNNWSSVSASQAGAKIDANIKDGFIYLDAVPNGGDIVIADGNAIPSSSSGEEEAIKPIKRNFPLTVFIENGAITATGAQGMSITIFNSLGQKIRETRGLGCEQKVYAGAKGTYIVKVGNKTFPVSL